MVLYFWLAFITLGIYAAVLLSIGTLMESWILVFLLFYNSLLTVALCFIGQRLKDSVCSIRNFEGNNL